MPADVPQSQLTRELAPWGRLTQRLMQPQTLLIDADDTLWENNVYFEQAIADFVSFLNHQHMTREEVREVLYGVERQTILERGYGFDSYAHSLGQTIEHLSVVPLTREYHDHM